MVFQLRLDTREVVTKLSQIERRLPRAIPRALNRGATSGRTVMVRAMARDTGLKAKDVRGRVSIERATTARHVASLSASQRRVPLIQFRARGPEPSRGKGRGVRARIPGGQGRYPNAFIATMRSGHRGVFRRTGRGRLPITELHGPSIARVFLRHVGVGRRRALEMMQSTLEHEYARAIAA